MIFSWYKFLYLIHSWEKNRGFYIFPKGVSAYMNLTSQTGIRTCLSGFSFCAAIICTIRTSLIWFDLQSRRNIFSPLTFFQMFVVFFVFVFLSEHCTVAEKGFKSTRISTNRTRFRSMLFQIFFSFFSGVI